MRVRLVETCQIVASSNAQGQEAYATDRFGGLRDGDVKTIAVTSDASLTGADKNAADLSDSSLMLDLHTASKATGAPITRLVREATLRYAAELRDLLDDPAALREAVRPAMRQKRPSGGWTLAGCGDTHRLPEAACRGVLRSYIRPRRRRIRLIAQKYRPYCLPNRGTSIPHPQGWSLGNQTRTAPYIARPRITK